jgi:hypothetical protein
VLGFGLGQYRHREVIGSEPSSPSPLAGVGNDGSVGVTFYRGLRPLVKNIVLFFVTVNQVLVRLWARRRQHV